MATTMNCRPLKPKQLPADHGHLRLPVHLHPDRNLNPHEIQRPRELHADGNPREMTIEAIARIIMKMTGAQSQLVYRPLPTDDPKVRQPDITRARTLLKWEPTVPLEEGLVKTIDYFRSRVR